MGSDNVDDEGCPGSTRLDQANIPLAGEASKQ